MITPGIHSGIAIEEYHNLPGVSNSMLSILAIHSPAHLKWRMDGGVKTSPSMEEGKLLHKLILEPESFDDEYAIGPEANRNTKEWKAFEATSPGKKFLKPSEIEEAQKISRSVLSHPVASKLLRNAHKERTLAWNDPETGVLCRCRPDAFRADASLAFGADLKKTRSAHPERFKKACLEYGYHRQAAFYRAGVRAVTGEEMADFFFIAFEAEPPYVCQPYRAVGEMIEQGEREIRELLRKYADCLSSGKWPGYDGGAGVMDINIPVWGYRRGEYADGTIDGF